MNDKDIVTMVNTRGRVMRVFRWEVDNLRKQGCKIIWNPKEEYYPQYDLSMTKPLVETSLIVDDEDGKDVVELGDILDVEEL